MIDFTAMWRDILAEIDKARKVIVQGLNSGSYTINGSSITGDISGNSIPWGAAGYPVDVAATEADGTAITAARSNHQHAMGILTTLGDLLYRAASAADRLAGNTTTTRKFLRQTGTGAASAAPMWDTLIASDIPAHAASMLSSRYEPLTNGDPASPDLLYLAGDVIMMEVAA